MDELVRNILAAYRQSIDTLDWMGPETKREAQAKLAKFDPKIAYPTKWRDYTALTIKPDDLLGNVMRARRFEYDRNIAKLGQADRPHRVGHDAADRQRVLQPRAATRSCSRPRSCSRRSSIRRPTTRRTTARSARSSATRSATASTTRAASPTATAPAQLVDRRGPPALRGEDEGARRAVRRVRAGARLPRQRRADARREHRRQLGPRDRVQGVPDLAARQAGAGDRRHDRRPALLHRLRDDLAQQGPRGRRRSGSSRSIRTRRANSARTARCATSRRSTRRSASSRATGCTCRRTSA